MPSVAPSRPIAEFQVAQEPKTTFNVGRIGGGTSVNSIPFEAWAEVDMRSARQGVARCVAREVPRGRRRCGGRREQALG
jgi:acetylornithine deacetylase/succinyl-diaminopimelate desuccinylase-like protein